MRLRNDCQNSVSRPPQRDGNRRTAPEQRCRRAVPAHPRQSRSATTEPATRAPTRRVVPRTEFRTAPPRYRNHRNPPNSPRNRIETRPADSGNEGTADPRRSARLAQHRPTAGPPPRRAGRPAPPRAQKTRERPVVLGRADDHLTPAGSRERSDPRRGAKIRPAPPRTGTRDSLLDGARGTGAGAGAGAVRPVGGGGTGTRSAHSRIPGVSSWTDSCRASRNRGAPRW